MFMQGGGSKVAFRASVCGFKSSWRV